MPAFSASHGFHSNPPDVRQVGDWLSAALVLAGVRLGGGLDLSEVSDNMPRMEERSDKTFDPVVPLLSGSVIISAVKAIVRTHATTTTVCARLLA
jgi:hypothetical protein